MSAEPEITLSSALSTSDAAYCLAGAVRAADAYDGYSVRVQSLLTGLVHETFLASDGSFAQALELAPGKNNPLVLTLCDPLGDEVCSLARVIQHVDSTSRRDSAARGLTPPGSPEVLARPIFIEVLNRYRQRGRQLLAPLGAILPGAFACTCRSADQSGRLVVPIYEDNRLLYRLIMERVDRNLPLASDVQVDLRIESPQTAEVTIAIGATGQRQHVTLDLAECRREKPPDTQPPSPPWAEFAKLVKHCLIEAGRVADRSGRNRDELFEQVYAQERYAEQAFAQKNHALYTECFENLGKFASYLQQLQQSLQSGWHLDWHRLPLARPNSFTSDEGMLEGSPEAR